MIWFRLTCNVLVQDPQQPECNVVWPMRRRIFAIISNVIFSFFFFFVHDAFDSPGFYKSDIYWIVNGCSRFDCTACRTTSSIQRAFRFGRHFRSSLFANNLRLAKWRVEKRTDAFINHRFEHFYLYRFTVVGHWPSVRLTPIIIGYFGIVSIASTTLRAVD